MAQDKALMLSLSKYEGRPAMSPFTSRPTYLFGNSAPRG